MLPPPPPPPPLLLPLLLFDDEGAAGASVTVVVRREELKLTSVDPVPADRSTVSVPVLLGVAFTVNILLVEPEMSPTAHVTRASAVLHVAPEVVPDTSPAAKSANTCTSFAVFRPSFLTVNV
jgi:hypothetical protein